MRKSKSITPDAYMNPYLAGFLLGLVLLTTIYVTGRGLGASGAFKNAAIASVETLAPVHAAGTAYYTDFAAENPGGPWKNFLIFLVIGVFTGAFFSGVLANRTGIRLDKGPGVTSGIRIAGAVVGGALFGFGSQLGRGCTSGSALSGMAVLSLGGILTMMAIFGGGYALAWFFRKLWIK
jgi:uncharacterized protein